ncbi:MAG TPA: PAS domain-containing protein [Gemmatirosa sp.]
MLSSPTTAPTAADLIFPGPGEMAARCRGFDWATTPLGPVDGWPQSLRTAAGIVLGAGFPSLLCWGPALVQIYNDGYVPIAGAKHPEALGRPTDEVWPEARQFSGPRFARAQAGETVHVAEAPYSLYRRGPDAPSDETFFTLSFSPVRDEAGAVGGVLVTLIDVTREVTTRPLQAERERLLAELAVERTRLADVFAQAPVGVAVLTGPRLVYTMANPRYDEIIGGGRPLLGIPVREAFPEVAGQGYFEMLEQVYATGAPTSHPESRVLIDRDRDGATEEYFYDLQFEALRDAHGAVYAVVIIAVDVTALVRSRREVEGLLAAAEHARAETARVLAATDDGLLGTDMDGRTTFANPAAERMLGWKAADMVGRPQHALIHHSHADGTPYATADCPLYHARKAGTSTRVEGEMFWRKDGTPIPVEYAMTPVFEDDAIVGAVVTFRDVSERRAAEAERARLLDAAEAAQRVAEEANRAKVEFLATMSHELRTPLNAIGGYAELLELEIRGPITPEQREDLARIRQSQRHLLRLINEVLNYAKLEAGSVHYAVADVPLTDMVASVAPLVEPLLAAKSLSYDDRGCGDAPIVARADRDKVRQVLLNLLSNAVKFTAPGGHVELRCASAAGGRVTIAVRDTGVGIAADQVERVFEPFVQVDAALTRQQEGTGLGLAISRDLARGMGGDLTVESAPGVGSTFTLALPER